MTRTAGDVRARATVSALDRARVPTPELLPPAPAKESTVQRDSWSRFSAWAGRFGWLAGGVVGLVVAAIVRAPGIRPAPGRAGGWLIGLALAFAGELWFGHEVVTTVWPALMHGHSLWGAVTTAGLLMGLLSTEGGGR